MDSQKTESEGWSSDLQVYRWNSMILRLRSWGSAEELHFDPEDAEKLQARMDTWLEMKRKYGGDLDAVIVARDAMRRQLEIQGDIEGTLIRLEKQLTDAKRLMMEAAKALQ